MIYMSPEGCFEEGEGNRQALEKKNSYLITVSSRPFCDPALKAPVDIHDLRTCTPVRLCLQLVCAIELLSLLKNKEDFQI